MIFDELPLPFPWYNDRRKQNRWRENCKYLYPYELIMPQERMLSFQFKFLTPPGDPVTVTRWYLYEGCLNGPSETSGEFLFTEPGDIILTEDGEPIFSESGLAVPLIPLPAPDVAALLEIINDTEGYTHIIYKGGDFTNPLNCLFYESMIQLSNGLMFWSEVFKVATKKYGRYPYMYLTWNNPCDYNGIIYHTGYTNQLYLPSFIANNAEELVEEVTQDGAGNEILEFQKIIYKYKFSEAVPDFLKTALVFMVLHKHKTFSDEKALRTFDINRMRIITQSIGSGAYSFVDITIERDQVLLATACC